jgi:hypothetical protein
MAAVGRNQTSLHFFLAVAAPHPARDQLEPESSPFGEWQAARTPVPGFR